jgi:hypothetical protein
MILDTTTIAGMATETWRRGVETATATPVVATETIGTAPMAPTIMVATTADTEVEGTETAATAAVVMDPEATDLLEVTTTGGTMEVTIIADTTAATIDHTTETT